MGNFQNQPSPKGGVNFPTWGMFPRIEAILMQGEPLPKELREFYFGIIEVERKFSNLKPEFVQYVRASINCVSMLERPYNEATSKEKTNTDQLKDLFASEINNCNIETKGMSQTSQAIDMEFLKTIMSHFIRQEQDITQHNYKRKLLGGEKQI